MQASDLHHPAAVLTSYVNRQRFHLLNNDKSVHNAEMRSQSLGRPETLQKGSKAALYLIHNTCLAHPDNTATAGKPGVLRCDRSMKWEGPQYYPLWTMTITDVLENIRFWHCFYHHKVFQNCLQWLLLVCSTNVFVLGVSSEGWEAFTLEGLKSVLWHSTWGKFPTDEPSRAYRASRKTSFPIECSSVRQCCVWMSH